MTVHPLGVGCRPIGGLVTGTGTSPSRSELQDDDARDGLKWAVKRGATVFDTADIYGLGHSERLVGQALAHDRDKVCITTRVAFRGTAAHLYAPPHLRHQLEQTLENLQTDYLDVVFLDADSLGDCFLEDAAVTVKDLRARRLIRAVGLSLPSQSAASDPAAGARLARVLDTMEPDVLAVRYNGLTGSPTSPARSCSRTPRGSSFRSWSASPSPVAYSRESTARHHPSPRWSLPPASASMLNSWPWSITASSRCGSTLAKIRQCSRAWR